MTGMRAMLILAAVLLAAPATHAQDTSKTGSGTTGSVDDLRAQFDQQWNGTPGQLVKGAIGLVGLALALSAANDAVSYQVEVDPGGASASSGGSGSSSGGTSTSTSTSTSTTTSSTSTN